MDRAAVIELFRQMRSGSGFSIDLRHQRRPSREPLTQVDQPALVVASRHEVAGAFTHAEALTARLPNAQLLESSAHSHLLWFGQDRTRLAAAIRAFLDRAPPGP